MHRDRLDHGAPAADDRAVAVQHRPAILQEGDIGGRAAHIGDDDVAFLRQSHRADHTGGGSGEDGFDRPRQGIGGGDQRTVALHHHQRCGDAELGKPTLDGADQPIQKRDQARVQQSSECPARRVKVMAQLVGAGHWMSGELPDEVAHG